ncbi:gas vesicle protein [bacterium]|nr:gas vesicle protein [bacterium]
MAKDMHQIIEIGREELSRVTGLEISTTLATVKDERGWRITIEMIEKHSIPDQMDILATYDVILDDDGKLVEFYRRGLRKRVDTETEEVE